MEFLPQSVKNAFSFLPPDLLVLLPSSDSLALLISPPFNPPPPPPPLFPVTFAANSAQKKGNRPTEEDFFPFSLCFTNFAGERRVGLLFGMGFAQDLTSMLTCNKKQSVRIN